MSHTVDLVRELERARVDYELIPHDQTMTALAEARVLAEAPEHVAKTVVLETETGFVRAVLPAPKRVDLEKVRQLVGDRSVELATEATLASAYPEFELGAVPPLGGGQHDRVLIDSRLTSEETIVFEAGRHTESIRLAPAALVSVTGATVADICAD
jgi:Ala-tRNA(Pro) deacylase